MKKLLPLFVLYLGVLLAGSSLYAQIPLGQWTQIDQGFAKCAQIGQSAGTATWDRDNYSVVDMKWKNGSMYAWITYPTGPATIAGSTTIPTPDFNYQPCNGGIFVHDTIQMRWFKVAEVPPATAFDKGIWMTNNQDIFFLSGDVYKLTTDYVNYPTGWQKLSKFPQSPLTTSMVWPTCPSCYGNSNQAVRFSGFNIMGYDAIADTIYVAMSSDVQSPKNTTPNTIAKFSITGQNWTFENIGPFPDQAYPNISSFSPTIHFADRVGGRFKYFYADPYMGNQNYIPSFFWVYDPSSKSWKNVSRGPDYNNFTGSACGTPACQACANAAVYNPVTCGPAEQGGPNVGAGWYGTGWTVSWDKKTVYANSQEGVYQWDGDQWLYMMDQSQGNIYLFTNNGGFGKGYFDMGPLIHTSWNGVYQDIGGNQIWPGGWNGCVHIGTGPICTPNDGKLIYIQFSGLKDINQCSYVNGYGADLGIYMIKPNPLLPSPVTNLHLQSGTYAGGSGGNNSTVNLGVGGKHNIYLAGNFANVQSQAGPGRIQGSVANTLLGANASQKGKIIVFNSLGDTIRYAVTLGDTIYDYEIMTKYPYWMVVSGDFGVAVLDSMAMNVVWSKTLATVQSDLQYALQLSSGGGGLTINYPIVDIDNQGHVAIGGGYQYEHHYIVYDQTGTALAPSTTCFGGGIPQWYLEDITIKNDTVYLIGWNQQNLDEPASTSCTGAYNGQPVQVAWVKAHSVKSGTGTFLFKSFGYTGNNCTLDQADTRLGVGKVGQDGNVYALGTAAGGNSIFRWNGDVNSTIQLNGCSDPPSALITYDNYNTPVNTAGAALSYYCTINPATGVVNRGQYIIPRLPNGLSNTFSPSYINADQSGYVYVGGTSTAYYSARPVNTINGQLVGKYAGGDMSILIVSPDYMSREYWGSFSDSLGVGNLNGIAIRDNVIAVCGTTNAGTMWTGASRYLTTSHSNCSKTYSSAYAVNQNPFNLDWNGTQQKTDAYLAVWYQDVWNYATCDSIHRTVLPSDSIISPVAVNYKTDFSANKTSVCVGSPVTFTNISVGDSIGWTWNFGTGASLLPGTTGRGPFTVTYSTPGYKSVRLDQILKGNQPDYEYKLNYINVLPANLTLGGPISGPDSVCSGATIYYSTPQVAGVTYYNWTVPPGSIILNGQGSVEIQVALGSASGNVSVSGTYDCGTTPVYSRYVKVNAPMPKSVLIVCGNHGVLNASETLMKNFLISRGYNVLTMWDSTAQRSNTECMGLVIVSTTVDTANLNFKLREISTPVIVMDPEMLGYMSMTNGNGGGVQESGTVSATQISLINNTNEMGEVTGSAVPISLNVYTSANNVAWGTPNSATAINIATIVGDTSQKAIFGYDQGVAMMGYSAPDRRVGFYLDISGFTSTGLPNYTDTLFARAVCWCFRNCPTNRIIRDSTNKTTYCAGDSITINYRKWGQFNGVTPANYPSLVNQVTVDNGNAGLVNSDGSLRFTATGNWNLQAATTGTVGTSFLDNGAQGGAMSAFFRPQIPYTGIYSVIINIPAAPASYGPHDSLATAAVVNITTTSGVVTKYVNERNGPKQVNLGNFEFAQGPSNLVEINTNYNTNGVHVIADAVTFQPVNLYPVGNIFTAQLSNQFGNFNFATVLATKQDTASGVMKGVIPASLASGTNYQVRVLASSPSLVSVTSPVITIIGPPQKPGPISGPLSECQGSTNISYCINSVPGATSYLWTKSLGMDFTSSPGVATYSTSDSCVSMNFTTSTGGPLMVQSQNSCGTSDPTTASSIINLNVTGFPPDPPVAIGGATVVCNAAGMTYTYTVTPVTGATSYLWTLPSGVTAVGGTTSNSIVLSFAGSANPSVKTIGVQAVGICGNSLSTSLVVTINNAAAAPVVGAITATSGTCSGDFLYTVNPILGATYVWTYPIANTVVTGTTNTNQLYLTYKKPTSSNVSVQVTNGCGTSTASLPVNITSDTSTLRVDLGPNQSICGPNILDAGIYSSYLWNTGATTREITISAAGEYKVSVTDAYGCTASDSVGVTTSNPTVPIAKDTTLAANVCSDASLYIYASGSSGNYRWYNKLSGGTLLDSSSSYLAKNLTGDTAFYVSAFTFGNPGKTISITNVNSGIKNNWGGVSNACYTTYLETGTNLTIETWVKYKNTAIGGSFVQDRGNLTLYVNGGTAGAWIPEFDLTTNAGTLTLQSTITIDTNWHHLAAVYNNGTASIYVDGVLGGTTTKGTFWSSNSGIGLGGNISGNGSNYLYGAMDEFRWWNISLTQAQIQANMNSCLVGNEKGLLIYYSFQNNMVNKATASGSVCNGSIGNAQYAGNTSGYAGPVVSCSYCESTREKLSITFDNTINPLASNSYTVCSTPATITLTATGGTGNYRWYNAPSGGTILDSAGSYTVSGITSNATYYVTSWDLGNPQPSTAFFTTTSDNGIVGLSCMSGGSGFTIESWIMTTHASLQYLIVDRFDVAPLCALNGFGSANGSVGWQVNGTNVPGSVVINDGTWHHIAMTFNNGVITTYVDGNIDNTVTTGTGFVGLLNDYALGGNNGNVSWLGGIDEFRYWSYARTQAQIQANMNRCLVNPQTGLVLYYPFQNNLNNAATGGGCNGGALPAGAVYLSSGPILSCTLCESSPRLATNITVTGSSLTTNALSKSVYCPGDSVSVPFSICSSPSFCHYGPVVDSFNTGTLNSAWNVLNLTGFGGASYSLAGNQLTLTAGGNDFSSTVNNPYVLYRTDITGNFDIKVKVTSLFSSVIFPHSTAGFIFANNFTNLSSGGYGIVGVSRRDNYIYGSSGGGFINGWNSFGAGFSGPIWIRLVKSGTGTTFTFYYSTDSVSWPPSQSKTITIPSAAASSQVGLYLVSADGATTTSISFDNFYGTYTQTIPNYYYVAELSDSTGSFAAATVLPDSLTISASTICNLLTDNVKSVLPRNVSPTASYNIRVYQRSATNAIVNGTTSVTSITFNENYWTGAISTDWNTAGNWSCGVPDSNSTVVIQTLSTPPIYYPLIATGTAYAKHLTITGTATVQINAGNTLKLWGNFTSTLNGFKDLGGGSVEMHGSIPQTITNMGSITYLSIMNSSSGSTGGVFLGSNLSITSQLAFNKGTITLGYYNLNICVPNNFAITGYGTNKFIITRNDSSSASGSLVRYLPTDSSAIAFPVGTCVGGACSYNPVTIYNTGTNAVCMNVRVFAGVLQHGLQGLPITSKFINRTWAITPQSPGAKVNVVMRWNGAAEEMSLFTRTSCFAVKNIGSTASSWVQIGPQMAAGGSNPYTAYGSNITTFSKFSVTSDVTLLPLDFVQLSGKNVNGNAALTWVSTSDMYCSKWYVERSYDGVDFEVVGSASCKFGSPILTYNFVDPELYRNKYYRVREVDIKGNSQVSNMILLLPLGSELEFQISPNPSVGATQLYSKSYLPDDYTFSVNLKSVYGVQVASYNNNLVEINKWLQQMGSNLSAATYIIEAKPTDQVYRFKWVLLK